LHVKSCSDQHFAQVVVLPAGGEAFEGIGITQMHGEVKDQSVEQRWLVPFDRQNVARFQVEMASWISQRALWRL
jgi:hypothetical protein